MERVRTRAGALLKLFALSRSGCTSSSVLFAPPGPRQNFAGRTFGELKIFARQTWPKPGHIYLLKLRPTCQGLQIRVYVRARHRTCGTFELS